MASLFSSDSIVRDVKRQSVFDLKVRLHGTTFLISPVHETSQKGPIVRVERTLVHLILLK